jgi:hypothetical protein
VSPPIFLTSRRLCPHYQYLIDKIEGVQRFFTKKLDGLCEVPYCTRLVFLQLESLEYRRLVCDLVLCYKIQHRLVDTELCNALTRSTYKTTRGHPCKLQKISCSTDVTKYFFTNRLHDLWNKLPVSVVAAETDNSFKHRLHSINLRAYLRFPCFHFSQQVRIKLLYSYTLLFTDAFYCKLCLYCLGNVSNLMALLPK